MINPTSLVSVIIPVKNGGRYLAAAIRSVLRQSYRSIEILVIDGGSDDDSLGIARSFPQVRTLCQNDDRSIAAARNLGIQSAQGEWISFISHDDLWAPDKLSRQVDYLERHPPVQYVITKVKFFLQPGCGVPSGFRKELLNGEPAGPMPETLLARKSLFARLGGFNPELGLLEDNDWFSRARDNHVPAALIPEVLVFKRIHDANISVCRPLAQRIHREMIMVAKRSIDRKRGQSPRGQDS